ncbi:MAG: bifunctional 2-C-methyl-D-erythritol 4-phosphate cytidylyltransferase/2-C-methyl-D-erythritol 2,4-cyclodiphosphate synthase [Proteobacteria bacterium]|nr:bifunctional 2-C-methyl-D-erythritol 4-phosphate cytidylyltransferase/2-C-methyl-D-erythritol 2,4-cyclodiphosphate synthase [Pseudomonadota bacterium]
MARCAALVLAGGSGSRFGGEIPKQYQCLGDRAVLRHAVESFLSHKMVDDVRVILRPEDRPRYDSAMGDLAILPPVEGGATRQESTRRGLESLREINPDTVLIHDGARPFADQALISRTLAALENFSGVIPALPISDTVKRAEGKDNIIVATVDRGGLWRAQTPQAFRYSDIRLAHEKAQGKEMTDDAMIAENHGLSVALVMGNEDNIKITTREDMKRAERILGSHQTITRIGTGFDVHGFCPGDHVVLGGVKIAHDFGLEGHSDADVALHALTDALLGAIGDGDIGAHFPPTDPQWRGAASSAFLRHAAALVRGRGGEISNVDVTVICERPKITPHRAAMRAEIAAMLDIDESAVSVKATTTEGLGFTGRREGIAAQAVAAIRLPMI